MSKFAACIHKLLCTGLLVLMSFAGLSACSTQQSNATPDQNNNPIKIGASVSLTGDFSSDGKALQKGYTIWQDAVNKRGGLLGRPVKLDFVNDDSNKTQVTTNYQKLITVNHDDLVVGPFSTGLTIPAAAVASRYNYALVEGAGTAPKVFQQGFHNLFSVSLPAADYLKSFVSYILGLPATQRPKKVAYVSSDDFFTHPQIDKAKEQLEKGGEQTALYTIYPAETTDYTPIAQKIISAQPDVVLLDTTAGSECIAYIKAFHQQHFNPKVLIATTGPDQGSQFTDPIGGPQVAEGIFVPDGGWYPALTSYQNDQFIKDYVAKYGGKPDDISADAAEAYSVGQVLEQAVNKTHSVDNAKLIQELHADTFNTIQGPVRFADDGQNTIAVPFLFQWQDQKLIVVYPSNAAQKNPQFPKKPWP